MMDNSLDQQCPNRFISMGEVVLLCLAFWFAWWRFGSLGETSLWLDEMMQVRIAESLTWPGWWGAIPRDKPPGEYFLLRLWGTVGNTDALLRLPAAMFGLLTVVPLFLITALIANRHPRRRAFLFGAVLLLTHPLHFSLSQQLLPYAHSLFWLSVCAASVLIWLRSRGKMAFVVMIVSTIGVFMTVYVSIFSLIGIFCGSVWILFRSRERKRNVSVLICVGVWIGVFAVLAAFCYWRIRPWLKVSPGWAFQSRRELLTIIRNAFFCYTATNSLSLAGLLIEIILLVFGFVGFRKKGGSVGIIMGWWLVLGLPLFLGAFAYANHWVADRYFLQFVIPYTVIQVVGVLHILDEIDKRWEIRTGAKAFGSCLAILMVVVLVFERVPKIQADQEGKDPFRQEVHKLVEAPDASVCIVDHDYTRYCYEFYQERMFRTSPRCVVFDPESTPQATHISAMERVFVYPVTFRGAPVSKDFARLLEGSASGGLSSSEALVYYGAEPKFPLLPASGRITMSAEDEGFLFYGWYGP